MKAFEFVLFLIGLLLSFGATCYCGISYHNSKMGKYLFYTIAFGITMVILGVALTLGAMGH